MRRSAYVWLAALLVAGLFAGYWLIPDDREMAYIHFRNKDGDLARREYRDLLSRGQNEVALLLPMVDLSIARGDLDTAAQAMELMVRQYPRHVEARRKWGQILRFQHRLEDYVANLEVLSELEPTETELRDLVRALDYLREYGRQIAALKKLIALRPDDDDSAEELAALQAALGRLPDAASTLQNLRARHPAAMTEARAMLLISLLLDVGRDDEAVAAASDVLARSRDSAETAELAGLLVEKGRPGLAIRVLEPMVDAALAARASGHVAGEGAPAGRNALPSGPVLMELADAARSENRPDFARKALALLGLDPSSAAGGPPQPGRAAIVAHWSWSAADKAGVASLWMEEGDVESAWRVLEGLLGSDDLPDWALADFVQASLQLNRAREGLAHMEELRRRRLSPAVDSAWCLLAAAAGEEAAAVAWLEARSEREPSDDVLEQLQDLAGERGLVRLGIAAAGRRVRRHPGDDERAAWVAALVEAGRPAEALTAMEGLRPDNAATEEVRLEALRAAARAGLSVRRQVGEFCLPRLARPGLDDATCESLLEALLESGNAAAALPRLRAFAESRGGDWEDAYEDALRKDGRKTELAARLGARADRPGLSAGERRSLAYDLLDLDDRPGAERILLALARDEPPSADDVAELRFLWGPRPEPAALDWIEARAQAAPRPEDQAAWLRMLQEGGEPRRVVDWVERKAPGREGQIPVLEAYLDALVEADDTNRLVSLVTRGAAAETRPEALRRYARAAADAGLDEPAGALYRRILAAVPGDRGATEALAALALARKESETDGEEHDPLRPSDGATDR